MICRLSVAFLFATASPLAAQRVAAGTATFQMTMHLPDSLKGKMPIPIGSELDIQMRWMTDGRRIAMEMLPGSSVPMIAGKRVRVIFTFGGDTVHVGILSSPEMAAAAGGSVGSRIDIPVAMFDSTGPLLGKLMDSIGKKMIDSLGKTRPTYRSLGTSATVAGITCQEWEIVVGTDTTRTCVIPTPSGLVSIEDQFKTLTGRQRIMFQVSGMAELHKQAYGGQEMTAIRTVNARLGMRMELTSFTAGVPEASLMELPEGLKPMAMPALPIKPGGGDRLK
jgi:hypothetical protein